MKFDHGAKTFTGAMGLTDEDVKRVLTLVSEAMDRVCEGGQPFSRALEELHTSFSAEGERMFAFIAFGQMMESRVARVTAMERLTELLAASFKCGSDNEGEAPSAAPGSGSVN